MIVSVVAKVNWRLMYTLAPNFEANVYISPKLQTWRLMCTLAPNLEAKVLSSDKTLIRVGFFVDEWTLKRFSHSGIQKRVSRVVEFFFYFWLKMVFYKINEFKRKKSERN